MPASRSWPHRWARWWARALLGLSAVSFTMPALAGRITTDEILTQTLQGLLDCLQWTLIGVCVWLNCGLSGCSVKLSLLYGHFNPDLVISAYHRVGETPWLETRVLYGDVQRSAGRAWARTLMPGLSIGEGNRANDRFARTHKDLRFKEADAIGHPLSVEALFSAAMTRGLAPRLDTTHDAEGLSLGSVDTTPLLCPSETTAFTPYLLSSLDPVAWRLSLPESLFPQALIPGVREIGQWPTNTWSALYPRSGFVLHSEDPKAGAVIAQRAGDIVTRTDQAHVYLPTARTRGGTGGLRVFYPVGLVEREPRTGQFQMLLPQRSSTCEVFGEPDLARSWALGKSDPQGDYAWTLWRPYECCQQRGIFIGESRWVDFP